jgi:DNA-binding transcriptional LysR family regulator
VTIRIATLEDSSLIARKLAPSRRVLAASPDYIAREGAVRHPDDLTRHRCLNFGHSSALQKWQLTQNGEIISVPIKSTYCSNNGDVLCEAAVRGQGITNLPTFIVGEEIRSGRLAVVLSEFPPTSVGIYALYTPNRYLAAKTRVLIDFLVSRFGDDPEWDRFSRR